MKVDEESESHHHTALLIATLTLLRAWRKVGGVCALAPADLTESDAHALSTQSAQT